MSTSWRGALSERAAVLSKILDNLRDTLAAAQRAPQGACKTAKVHSRQARDKLRRLQGYTGDLVRVDLIKLLPLTHGVVVFFTECTVRRLGADRVNPIRLPHEAPMTSIPQ